MKIMLVGATGFIGRHLARALVAAGHDVTGCARRRTEAFHRYPEIGWMKGDFTTDRSVLDWKPRVTGFDCVINAAGILRERDAETFEAVHFEGPRALFEACAKRGVRKVIQISALGCDPGSERPYEATKMRLEALLATLDLDWVAVRPSLVYGEDSPSSALFRFLAGLPVIPLIAGGGQLLQPIHVDDLALAVTRLLAEGAPNRVVIELGGPRPVTYRELLEALRAGLHDRPGRYVSIPLRLARVGAAASDLAGVGPFGTDTLNMLMRGNTTGRNEARRLLGREPRSVHDFGRAGARHAGA
jgi:nucleoside-diphosphate-sugar epimerase